ncbi:MAG: hypothetical protein FGF48_07285, partial [Candidatus Brockarchaeota archaeon]|nr:hypothetical protein [Candidatus Brockarchaeota archaeon]
MEAHIAIWIPSKIRGKKRKMLEAEIEELYEKVVNTTITEDWRLDNTGDSWLMLRKGFKYLPDIVDSARFFLEKFHEGGGIDPASRAYRLWRNPNLMKDGIKSMYLHAGKLIEKVDVRIKKIKDFGEPYYFLCWHVGVVGLEEVRGEVERLLKEKMFSKENIEDRKLVGEYIKKYNIDVVIPK